MGCMHNVRYGLLGGTVLILLIIYKLGNTSMIQDWMHYTASAVDKTMKSGSDSTAYIHRDSNASIRQTMTVHTNKHLPTSKLFDKKLHTYSTVGCNKQFYNSHYMTASFNGRTGNLMFEYAMLLATAWKYCYKTYSYTWKTVKELDDSFYLPDSFMKKEIAENTKALNEKGPGLYDAHVESLNTSTNWTFNGYRQSWRYFEHVEDHVRDAFTFKDAIQKQVGVFLHDVVQQRRRVNLTKVAVHVRRTDMTQMNYERAGFGVADITYITHAMTYFRKRFAEIVFVFVSDDIKWCKSAVHGRDVIFSPFQSTSLDLALIVNCDHVVITSGTFAWWAAWLSGGMVVYYSGYPIPGSDLDRRINRTDYYPSHWTGML